MSDHSGAQVAAAYLKNAANRGIFDRPAWYAESAGIAGPQEQIVSYLLGPAFRAGAHAELHALAPKWERALRTPVRRVLDAGCGPGITTLALAARYEAADVVGIDVEAPAIALARHLADDEPRCRFEEVSIEAFDDPDGFDVIQCRMVIEHVYDAPGATRRLVSMLRPGGVAYLEMPNYLWPWEPHVQLPMLPRSPKWILGLQCRLAGRDHRFVRHLNFECNPISVRRWIGAVPGVDVIDLMSEKVAAQFAGAADSVVPSRARTVARIRRVPAAARAAQWALQNLPVAPSVMLVAARHPQDGAAGDQDQSVRGLAANAT